MLEYLTLGEFIVAALMVVAALCAFVWGVASGAFTNMEGVKHDVLKSEGVWGSSVAGPPSSKKVNGVEDR